MEFLAGLDLTTIGFVGLATFGAVSAVNFFKKLDSKTNFALSILFAFIFSFVPTDLGNLFLNKAKEAISTAVVLSGAYQFLGGVVAKFGTNPTKKVIHEA